MAELTFTLKIPALDRLCDWLERGATVNVASTVPVLVDVPEEPVKAEPMPGIDPEALRGPKQPPKAEPVQVPTQEPAPTQPEPVASPAPTQPEPVASPAPAQPEPVASPAPALTVNDLMRAAAALRDQGKLAAVTGLFPQFGIKKISDLAEDQLGEFADHLRKLGAQI